MSALPPATVSAKLWQPLRSAIGATRLEPAALLVILGCAALVIGLGLTLFGSTLVALGGIALLVYGIILVMRQDELLATLIMPAAILIDWYRLPGSSFQLPIVALTMGALYIIYQFWTQSPATPWVPVAQLPLWLLWLVVSIPAILHSNYLIESVRYWIDVMLTGLVMYLVGTQIAANRARLTRLLNMITVFGVLMAFQSVLFVKTGIFILSTNRLTTYLSSKGNFHLGGGAVGNRAGSYLLNPDWNGSFLAMMLFVPVGLAIATTRRSLRLLYSAAALLIAVGLFYTYSLAAIIAVVLGGVILVLLLLPAAPRRLALIGLGTVSAVLVGYLLLHIGKIIIYVTTDYKIAIRIGAWTTGVKVILAYPLFGVGLGLSSYLAREEAYRLPLQPVPLDHPHNSYLELGAMGGVVVMVIFLLLLGGYFRLALRNYRLADRAGQRLLLGPLIAMIVVAINSFGINEWTLAPLLVPAWLLIGAVTSPYATRTEQAALLAESGSEPLPEPARVTHGAPDQERAE